MKLKQLKLNSARGPSNRYQSIPLTTKLTPIANHTRNK